ncbi:hypothetical protein P6P35_15260, partial [Clostridium perfringens]|nr:hypothetical protein [Clostridium perfringens]MDK0967564.1 hypothetical protein [Clostridium perfringens]
KKSNHLAGLFAIQKFIQTYIIFKERVILQIVKLFFHNNLTDSFSIITGIIFEVYSSLKINKAQPK